MYLLRNEFEKKKDDKPLELGIKLQINELSVRWVGRNYPKTNYLQDTNRNWERRRKRRVCFSRGG